MRKNAYTSPWTDEMTARLTELWAAGYSCAQIADIIGGLTRNAIIGKVHRMNLPSRDRKVFNVNSATRFIDPTPPGTPRASPKSRAVFKMRERKPRVRIVNPSEKAPTFMVAFSPITGRQTGAVKVRRPGVGEMTKDQLRAMLAQAVQNTAAMEAAHE